MRNWIRSYGFPALVLLDLIGAGCLAASVRVPDRVPDLALQAAPVYRLEVGAACFILVYLAAMAFFLALDGRGFAEIGTRGLKATEVVRMADEQEVTIAEQMKLIRYMDQTLKRSKLLLDKAVEDLQSENSK